MPKPTACTLEGMDRENPAQFVLPPILSLWVYTAKQRFQGVIFVVESVTIRYKLFSTLFAVQVKSLAQQIITW